MIGIDLCSALRLRRVHERHGERFTRRVFTEGEMSHALRKKDPWPHLAARWAAKEAVRKALGKVEGFRFTDVEVVTEEGGRPGIRLGGATLAEALRQGFGSWHVSISHEEDMAACVVLACPGGAR